MIHPYILHDQGQQILGNHESLTKRNYWEIYRTLIAEKHPTRKRTSLSEASFGAKGYKDWWTFLPFDFHGQLGFLWWTEFWYCNIPAEHSGGTKIQPKEFMVTFCFALHPWKLTWNPKMEGWKMIFLFKQVIFKVPAVNFPGCSWKTNQVQTSRKRSHLPLLGKGIIKGDSRDPQWWDLMVSFPYYSHIFRDSYGSGMGIVWEAYHKGVPLLGVPANSSEITILRKQCLGKRIC